MTVRFIVLASLLFSGCLTRNDLGRQVALEPDGGAEDASADAAPDSAQEDASSPMRALEACLLGQWSFCMDESESSSNNGVPAFVGITFLMDEKLSMRACGSGSCQDNDGRWKVTNVGSDGFGSVAWQLKGAPVPSYFDRVICEDDVFRYEVASGFGRKQTIKLTRGAIPAPCE